MMQANDTYRVFWGTHPYWRGPLHLYEDARLVRPGVDTGKYDLREPERLILNWDQWPTEILEWSADRSLYVSSDGSFTVSDDKGSYASRSPAHRSNDPSAIAHVKHWNRPAVEPFDNGKIAFLFLTITDLNQPEIWEEYLRGYENNYSIYCHAKEPESVTQNIISESIIEEYFPTQWGDISLVRATLALLREALKDSDNKAFVLCSESCVPIRPFETFLQHIKLHSFGIFHMRDIDTTRERNWDKANRSAYAPEIPAHHWMFHRQWFMMGRLMAEAAVEDDITDLFEYVFAPDECYFGTLLSIKGFAFNYDQPVKHNTYCLWDPNCAYAHPFCYDHVDQKLVQTLLDSHSFFARKFSASSDISAHKLHVD